MGRYYNYGGSGDNTVVVNGIRIETRGGEVYVNGSPVPSEPTSPPETVQHQFDVSTGTKLVLDVRYSNVTVAVGDVNRVVVSVTGPKDLVDISRVTQGNGSVAYTDGSRSGSYVSTRGITVVNGAVSISTGDQQVYADIAVPRGTAINVKSSGVGCVLIGDIGGPLTAHMSGVGDLVCEAADGRVDLTTTGTGNIRVKDGQIGRLTARSTGTGDITVMGMADEATLRSSGTGDVHLAHCLAHPERYSTCLGRVTVDHVG